jgi:hypothetical protein
MSKLERYFTGGLFSMHEGIQQLDDLTYISYYTLEKFNISREGDEGTFIESQINLVNWWCAFSALSYQPTYHSTTFHKTRRRRTFLFTMHSATKTVLVIQWPSKCKQCYGWPLSVSGDCNEFISRSTKRCLCFMGKYSIFTHSMWLTPLISSLTPHHLLLNLFHNVEYFQSHFFVRFHPPTLQTWWNWNKPCFARIVQTLWEQGRSLADFRSLEPISHTSEVSHEIETWSTYSDALYEQTVVAKNIFKVEQRIIFDDMVLL